jgi:hypothetical protein
VADPVPAPAAARTLEAADRLLDGRVTIFGRDLPLLPEPDWHSVLHAPGRWPLERWWRIDIRSDRRIGDVKWVWELGRHRHLVILARAAYLQPAGASLALLEAQLRSWLAQNPPEQGVHWYSNLEICLRAIAWLQILALAGDLLPDDLTAAMTSVLFHSGRHLMVDLPYTVSSMRNNHLLGDALGLVALGKAFGATRGASRRWAGVGDRLFMAQLRRHMRADGSMIEDSLGYHRFVLEMLATRVLLGDPPEGVIEHLVAGSQFLARLGVGGDGVVPQYGDWDEGRVLASIGHPADLTGTVHVALALGGSGALARWREAHDEVCWYAAEGVPVAPEPAERCGHPVGGGLARAENERFTVVLKAGGGRSHGHADLCSTVVAVDDGWVVGDPGTGTYNGPLEERNYFRSSPAHSVVRVDGTDQLEPHRAFRWRHAAQGSVGPPLRHAGGVVLWGVHNAYRRLDPPRWVVRAVVLEACGVTVADWVSGPPGAPCAFSLPLAPGASWEDGVVVFDDGTKVQLVACGEPTVTHGRSEPYDGWWSDTLGHAVPATRLEVEVLSGGPVWWIAGDADLPRPVVETDRLCLQGFSLTVELTDEQARLVLVEDGIQQVAVLTLPS